MPPSVFPLSSCELRERVPRLKVSRYTKGTSVPFFGLTLYLVFMIGGAPQLSNYVSTIVSVGFTLLIGCLRFTRLCWVGKHRKHYYENNELPNPRKIKVKVAFGPLFPNSFPQNFFFRGLGLIWYRKQTARQPTQPKFSANTLLLLVTSIGCSIVHPVPLSFCVKIDFWARYRAS